MQTITTLALCFVTAACSSSASSKGAEEPPTVPGDGCAPLHESWDSAARDIEQGSLMEVEAATKKATEAAARIEANGGESDPEIDTLMDEAHEQIDASNVPCMEKMLALQKQAFTVVECFKAHNDDTRLPAIEAMQKRFDAIEAKHTELIAAFNAANDTHREASGEDDE